MKYIVNNRFTARVIAPTVFLASTIAFASPNRADNVKAVVPGELNTLIQTVGTAVNAKDFEALKPLAEGDAQKSFAWIKETSTKKWEAGVVAAPSPETPNITNTVSKEYLAVFHAFHTCESDGDHIHKLLQTANGWKLGEEIPETNTLGFRIRDHQLKVAFDIPQKTAQIQDVVTIERTATEKPPFVLLRLSEDFHVSYFATKEAGSIPFQQAGGILVFQAPDAKKFTVEMRYDGRVVHQGSDYIRENEATLNSYWYPHIARLPATATVTVSAPRGWTPIGQGDQTNEQTDAAGTLTRTFRNDIPTCYFTVDIGKYNITTRKAGNRTLNAYLLQNNAKLAQESLDQLEKALPFFEKTFGKFPYKSYTVVETQGPFGGALEAYSFATFGGGSLPGALVHELSHTWWGGTIPCAYTTSMWNESFADYSDGLFERVVDKAPDHKPSPIMRRANANAFNAFPMTTAHDTSDDRQGSVGYGKGALVLRVLEEEIGLETMKKCMATFYEKHPRGEAADWPEFEAVVNKVTGKDYHWFFAQWVEQPGLPVAYLDNVTSTKNGDEYTIEADFVQTRKPYRLSVPILLETKNGDVATVLTTTDKTLHVKLKSKSTPVVLRVDPHGVLPLGTPAIPGVADPLVYTFK